MIGAFELDIVGRAATFPGLLAYHNARLASGGWANLVVFRSHAGTTEVTRDPIHASAVARTPHHYRSLRLHRGVLADRCLGAAEAPVGQDAAVQPQRAVVVARQPTWIGSPVSRCRPGVRAEDDEVGPSTTSRPWVRQQPGIVAAPRRCRAQTRRSSRVVRRRRGPGRRSRRSPAGRTDASAAHPGRRCDAPRPRRRGAGRFFWASGRPPERRAQRAERRAIDVRQGRVGEATAPRRADLPAIALVIHSRLAASNSTRARGRTAPKGEPFNVKRHRLISRQLTHSPRCESDLIQIESLHPLVLKARMVSSAGAPTAATATRSSSRAVAEEDLSPTSPPSWPPSCTCSPTASRRATSRCTPLPR